MSFLLLRLQEALETCPATSQAALIIALLSAFIIPIGALVTRDGLAALASERRASSDFWEQRWHKDLKRNHHAKESQIIIENYRQEYNHCRLHSSRGYLPPAVFIDKVRLSLPLV